MDDAMTTKAFRQFAQILVDVDLSFELCNRVLVEQLGFAHYVDLHLNASPHCVLFAK